jgi:hypothetical protein
LVMLALNLAPLPLLHRLLHLFRGYGQKLKLYTLLQCTVMKSILSVTPKNVA